MNLSKADIIAKLQKEIHSLQTAHVASLECKPDVPLGSILNSFPDNLFPVGAIHEFICSTLEDAAATMGFVAAVTGYLMKYNQPVIWILSGKTLYPPAFSQYGIEPHKIIFIYLKKENEMLWAMEEALKCEALCAVIADIPNLNFTCSRRLQLAVEKSKVTGFVLRQTNKSVAPTACVSRWKIKTLPSTFLDDMPGVGFPRWNVHLQKIRNGKSGTWNIEWKNPHFMPLQNSEAAEIISQKRAV